MVADAGPSATFQVADVTRPILSVARLTESGHQVRFTKEGGSICNRTTGKEVNFVRFRGVYVLEAWISDKPGTTGFTRQVTP